MSNKQAAAKKKRNPSRPKNALYKPALLKNKKKEQLLKEQQQNQVNIAPPKKQTKKVEVVEELDDEELKRQLSNIMGGDGVEFDDDDDFEDDEEELIDFDEEGEEELVEARDSDEEEEEVDEEEVEEEEVDEEEEKEFEDISEGEELEDDEMDLDSDENPDEEADELFNELNNNLKEVEEENEEDDEDEEHPTKRLKSQPSAIPTKKLTEKVNFTGNAFQGVASVESILAQQNAKSSKPIAKPVKIVNPQEELENELARQDIAKLVNEDENQDEEVDNNNNNKNNNGAPLESYKSKFNKYEIYDQEGITQKILELQSDKVPWVHSLSVLHKSDMNIQDIHDDFVRESTFYKFAVDSVIACEKLCGTHNLAVRRKPDFFAEMIKSDEHMFRVKARIQKDKKRVELGDLIRKKREIKKFGKQIQAEKIQERQKQKTDVLDNVKKWRKARERGNTSDEFSIDLLDEDENNRNKNKNSAAGSKKRNREEFNNLPKKSKKREAKDSKYGFGGKKKYAKTNDASSTNDFSSFNFRKNDEDKYSRGKGGKSGAGTKGANKGGAGASKGGPKSPYKNNGKARMGKSKRIGSGNNSHSNKSRR